MPPGKDPSPDDEREICKWAKETHQSDLVFITHYPTKTRPFYTYPDDDNPEFNQGFDLIGRGVEWLTGGRRIHDYAAIMEHVKEWGIDPKNIDLYLQALKFGLPPLGGFAFGAERITMQILNLANVREASLFPRDMERVDSRLSNAKKINWFWGFLFVNSVFLTWNFFTLKPNLLASPAFFESPSHAVVKNENIPSLSTQYYLVIDPVDNQIVAGNLYSDRIYPASVTKLVTALTALNLYPLDEVITTRTYSVGKTMNLLEGEKVTVNTLVSSLLIYSANDAAFNLAEHINGGPAAFVDQMNLLVKKYGLSETHFTNYDGLHDPNHYSTLYDLSQIARLSLKLPSIVSAVKIKEVELTDLSGQIKHRLVSTNELFRNSS